MAPLLTCLKMLNIEENTWLLFLIISFLMYLVMRYTYKSISIYDNFERVGNPVFLPKFLGKSANTLFATGFSKVVVYQY